MRIEWRILFEVNFDRVTPKKGICAAINIGCEIYHELQKSKGFKGYRNNANIPDAALAFICAAYDFVDPTAEMSANAPLNSYNEAHLQHFTLEPTPTREFVADLLKIVRAIVNLD